MLRDNTHDNRNEPQPMCPDISWPTHFSALCQHVSPQARTVTALLEIRLTGP